MSERRSGTVSGQLERTPGHVATVDEGIMLLRVQQVALPGMLDDEPVVYLGTVTGVEVQTRARPFVGAAPGKTGKGIDDIAFLVDRTLVCKSMPFEATVSQDNLVAFESNTVRLVLPFMIGARGK